MTTPTDELPWDAEDEYTRRKATATVAAPVVHDATDGDPRPLPPSDDDPFPPDGIFAEPGANPLSLSASISRKVNLGNYESAEVFVSVSGLTYATTEEEIDELLSGVGAIAWRKLGAAVNEKAREMYNGRSR